MEDKTMRAVKRLAYGFKQKRIIKEYNKDGEMIKQRVEVKDIPPNQKMLSWLVNYENGNVAKLEVDQDEYGLYEDE